MPTLMPIALPISRAPSVALRRSVLYADDSDLHLLLMSVLFRQRPDLHLVPALSTQQALQLGQQLQPSLLLLDLMLPDGCGCALLAQLREIPCCRLIPAVAVTADEQFDWSGRGFVERWRKPLDFAKTLERLDQVLSPPPTPPC